MAADMKAMKAMKTMKAMKKTATARKAVTMKAAKAMKAVKSMKKAATKAMKALKKAATAMKAVKAMTAVKGRKKVYAIMDPVRHQLGSTAEQFDAYFGITRAEINFLSLGE